jgi:hypothetical protein
MDVNVDMLVFRRLFRHPVTLLLRQPQFMLGAPTSSTIALVARSICNYGTPVLMLGMD